MITLQASLDLASVYYRKDARKITLVRARNLYDGGLAHLRHTAFGAIPSAPTTTGTALLVFLGEEMRDG